MLSLLNRLEGAFKRKCPFKVGDNVYPKKQFANLYYLFPNGPLPVYRIEKGTKEHGWWLITVVKRVKKRVKFEYNTIHARVLEKK